MWQSANEYRRTSATPLRLFTIQLLLLTAWKWKLMRRFCLQFCLYRFCFGSYCNDSLCKKEAKFQANRIIQNISLIQYGCSHYLPLRVYKKAYIFARGSHIEAISFFIFSFFGDYISKFHHCSIEIFAFENISLYYIYTMIFLLFVSWYEQIHRIVHWILMLALYLSQQNKTKCWKYAMFSTQCGLNCIGWTPNQTVYCVWEMELEFVAKKLVWELLWLSLCCTIRWGWHSSRTNGTE